MKVRIYGPGVMVFQNLSIAEMLMKTLPGAGDRAYLVSGDAFEHIGAGVQVRPQTSAGIEVNGPAACGFARGTVTPSRDTAGPLRLSTLPALPQSRGGARR